MNQALKNIQVMQLTKAQKAFVIYVRTLQFMKTKLGGIEEDESVHIPQKEIQDQFFCFHKYDFKEKLHELVKFGELEISEQRSPSTGRRMLMYKALKNGKKDLFLLKPPINNLDKTTTIMMSNLKRVSLPPNAPSTPYFDAFHKFKDDLLELFFKVDTFAGRVHTPVTSFHRSYRPNILIDNCQTIGLDVATMQPLLLGKILRQKIGKNQFSKWIDSGQDVYVMLQQTARLETRDQGKKRFFEILFSPPSDQLAKMFGDADWITWINQYKNAIEPGNPHNDFKRYSNLAWLLQTTEVQTMRKVWQLLNREEIPFLSVHDEIIVKEIDIVRAEALFRDVMGKEFTFYKFSPKETIKDT